MYISANMAKPSMTRPFALLSQPGKYDSMIRQFHGDLICHFDAMISALLQDYQK